MPLPIEWAQATWAAFHAKFQELTGEQLLQNRHWVFEQSQQFDEEQTAERNRASRKIAHWWRVQRNSGKKIPINPNGLHTQAFRTYLNGKTLKKRLSHDLDQALLRIIQSGKCWRRPDLLQDPTILSSSVNLFASGKITWQQKATFSSVVQTQRTFGDYRAYPIMDATGGFSTYARQWLIPFLNKGFAFMKNDNLNSKEIKAFLALVNTLPPSERFFFIFPHQKIDENGSHPSPHNDLRKEASNLSQSPGHRFMKAKNKTQYEGVLKLSFGAEDALGLAGYGIRDWFGLIPILGHPTIEVVDYFGQRMARPMISADSIHLGIMDRPPVTHDTVCELTDVEAHDCYHRFVASQLGENVHLGVERLIHLSRDIFGIRWGKDLWLLRDFDLGKGVNAKSDGKLSRSLMGPNEYGTKCFMAAISTSYLKPQLGNCRPEIQKSYLKNKLMFSPYNKDIPHSLFPHQIALIFLIDLVKNPHIWQVYHIVPEEAYFEAPYLSLLKMAKYLHEQKYFGNDMKANILKLEAFVKTQSPLAREPVSLEDRILGNIYGFWEAPQGEPAIDLQTSTQSLFEKIESELPLYEAHRDNSRVYLGFRKKETKKNKETDIAPDRTSQKKTKIN